MNKTSLIVLSLAALSLKAGSFEMGPESVHVPSRLAGASVSFDDGSFYVNQGTQTAKVESYNLDSTLRGISSANLTTFLDHGYLMLNQNSEGEFSLKANGRVLGGNKEAVLAAAVGAAAVGVVIGIGGIVGATTNATRTLVFTSINRYWYGQKDGGYLLYKVAEAGAIGAIDGAISTGGIILMGALQAQFRPRQTESERD